MTTTHTYAILKVPMATYRVIRGRIEEAGCLEDHIDEPHVKGSEVIDMNGIALQADTCDHDPADVVADVLEGDAGELGVQWCRACGAYRRTGEAWEGEWREPGI